MKKGDRWDISGPHQLLVKLADTLPKGRALVPGCGRGYDVALLAGPDRFVVGLEYSATAAKAAREYIAAEHPDKAPFCRIDEGDFFAYSPADGAFDFIWDYTFFCAMLPARRGEWGARMAALLSPGGTLVTMQFPLVPYPPGSAADFTRGPPFLLKPSFYVDALSPHGLVEVEGYDVEEALSAPPRKGSERFAAWKKA